MANNEVNNFFRERVIVTCVSLDRSRMSNLHQSEVILGLARKDGTMTVHAGTNGDPGITAKPTQ